ncbi:MAG TPA: NADPH:quinone oxidoreductase family protein [Candidatus Hydrogenedentes bacterium]|nr:NADPH:quinone oxidoreductase family protein [Candidatus Hydrogenedentota bacterium]
MRAVVCREISEDIDTLVIEDIDTPSPYADEVLIGIRACSVNFPDILMVQGKYQFKPDLPFTPGMEVSGDVLEVGCNVENVSVGDRVMASTRIGGYAEAVVAPADAVRKIPESLGYDAAAALPAAYNTAYVSLVRRGDLQPGETLLVHGATGGVGLAAVELGKYLGATVIATGGTDEKLKVVMEKGADHVINYTREDGSQGGFRERVKELTGGKGADVIYDPVGGDVFDESVRCIAWGGRLLVIGFTSGRIPTVPVNMPLIKGFSVVGVRAGEFGRRNPALGKENIETVIRWASEGKLNPHICSTFPLDRSVEAMQMLANRKVVGKVVINP